MGVKNDIDITIGGKTFTLSGVESEEYLREVAAYLNTKIKEFSEDSSYWRLPNDLRNVMLQFNLADDYFKEHSRVSALEARVQDLEEQGSRSAREIEVLRRKRLPGSVFWSLMPRTCGTRPSVRLPLRTRPPSVSAPRKAVRTG